MSGSSPRTPGTAELDYLVDGSSSRRRLLDLAEQSPAGRTRALLLDPSLAVAGRVEAEFTDDDVAQVKHAVLAARRLDEFERSSGAPTSRWLSGLAAALVLLLLVLTSVDSERGIESTRTVLSTALETETVITHPGVEAINLPTARVYELADENFEVVLIVDESFEL